MPWHPVWEGARVVPSEQFVTRQRARQELGLRFGGTVNIRISNGYLEGAVLGEITPDLGVSRSSLDAEVRWWQEATLLERLGRHARTVFW
jgi:hypothetical protein